MQPPLITFEGGEGVGKTTQSALLVEALKAKNINVIHTREPGGSEGAEAIRTLLVTGNADRWDPYCELLLHFAARRSHIMQTLQPAFKSGQVVICDRFIDSTIAYQHYGHGVPVEMILRLAKEVAYDLQPILTFVLTLPDSNQGLKRTDNRLHNEDRYESMGSDFHQRVAYGFKAIAAAHPERCIVIDASHTVEVIHQQIITHVNRVLNVGL